jgi:hypothetical protein
MDVPPEVANAELASDAECDAGQHTTDGDGATCAVVQGHAIVPSVTRFKAGSLESWLAQGIGALSLEGASLGVTGRARCVEEENGEFARKVVAEHVVRSNRLVRIDRRFCRLVQDNDPHSQLVLDTLALFFDALDAF